MRGATSAPVFLALIVALCGRRHVSTAAARNPSRPHASSASYSRRGGSSSAKGSRKAKPSHSAPRRRPYEDFSDEEDEEETGFSAPDSVYEDEDEDSDAVYDDEEDEEVLRPLPSKQRRGGGGSSSRRAATPASRQSGRSRGGPPPRQQGRYSGSRGPPRGSYDEEYDEEYDYPPPRRGSRSSTSRRGRPPPRRGDYRSSGGRRHRDSDVVPYVGRASQRTADTFTRGLAAIRESIPDPGTVRDVAASGISAARDTTKKMSNQFYREVKGLTSSKFEMTMLKATRPDDSPAKGKQVEELIGLTYQISPRQDIYEPVLRKLWSKMVEKDWRTTIKALYVLHRYSCDGAPDHAPALKARLLEYRKTPDPKRKNTRYFNSKLILAVDATPENEPYRAFLARYAHYVLFRSQCFSGRFREIAEAPPAKSSRSKSPKPQKPITATSLRADHLEAAQVVLKRGCNCELRDGEECENTAIAAERVASDLIGLTTAVAIALNRALKGREGKGADPELIKRWCKFYSEELQPQTKAMVKKTSAKLDEYDLYLPSRMGASVSPELLQQGLRGADEDEGSLSTKKDIADKTEPKAAEVSSEAGVKADEKVEEDLSEGNETVDEEDEEEEMEESPADEDDQEEVDEYDEYDYEEEEEEYYDDEEA